MVGVRVAVFVDSVMQAPSSYNLTISCLAGLVAPLVDLFDSVDLEFLGKAFPVMKLPTCVALFVTR